VSSTVFHTGAKGWFQDATVYRVLARRFDDTELSNPSGKYTVSAWVKTSGTNPNLLWYVRYNNQDTWPAFVAAQGLGTWEYLESTLDLSQYPNIDFIEVYARNSLGTPEQCYWDDLRFYPAGALVNTTAFDPKTFVVTAQSDPAGMTSFRLYDSFGRPMANKNTDEKLLNSVFLYFSRDGNSGNFSSSDPNYVRNVVSQSDGLISDFADGTASGWTANSGTWAVGNGVYTQSNTTNTNTNSYRSCTQAGKQYYRWKVSFIGGPNRAAGMHIMASDGSQTQRGNSYLIWQSNSIMQVYETINNVLYARQSFSFPAQTGETHVYEVLYDAGRLDIWRNGKYVGNWTDTVTPLTSGSFISLRTNGTHASFDDVIVQGDPAITVTFSDGLGREIQSQTWNGSYDLIAKTTYNSIGLVEKQFKPQELSNPNHAYYSAFTGIYELFEYFDDPLARLLKQTHMGGGSWITYAYGSAAFNTDPNSYTFRYVKVTDEETSPGPKISRNYFDKFGRQVGGVDAVGTADSIKWVNDYDILGNVKTVKPPNYWNPPSGTIKTDWDLQNSYDTFGRLTQKETPDEGITKFVYDKNGNLRYSQDAHQADPSRYDFTVYYYDAFNRISLVGEEYDDYSWSTTPPSLANTTYGTEASEWKIKYAYDANQVIGVTNYCQGKLTKTEVNDDIDNTTEHTTLYVYDKLGNLTDKRVTIDGGSPITEKIIRHSYDLLRRETQLTYPSGNVIARQFDPAGRLKKIYTIQ
ncbi:MAG: DUF6443 domain-containing protein, partial [Anaerolineae bacterium]|nr:DUF6443 domain-containing protein [Anaerolineae bacterium]